ncbi:hypothetical protein [Pseudoxanthobacter sp.]|uniref:hypothetical protein n=1 Tax=Pseudoxanthobacter sp. TaxID=1925742 RepID=UPI002FE0ACD7
MAGGSPGGLFGALLQVCLQVCFPAVLPRVALPGGAFSSTTTANLSAGSGRRPRGRPGLPVFT